MRTIYLKWTVIGLIFTVSVLLVLTIRVNMNSGAETIETLNINQKDLLDPNVRSSYLFSASMGTSPKKVKYTKSVPTVLTDNIKIKLIKVAKLLSEARKHVRGTKTGDAIAGATNELIDIFQDLKLNYSTAVQRTIVKSPNVCPEVYNGTTFGYPFFYKGFEVTNCSHGQSLDSLVTIVVVDTTSSGYHLPGLLKNISTFNEKLMVKLGTYNDKSKLENFASSKVEITTFPKSVSVGSMWNSLLKSVKTEYVLIAPNITSFNIDARLDRLIREIERLQLSAAAGALRDQNGYWKEGCYQRAFKNSTIVYVEGYDESVHECIICDHMEGPFVIRTDKVLLIGFDESLPLAGLFEDFFLRLDGEKATCPDSMFYIETNTKQFEFKPWQAFFKKHQLYKLKYGSREIVTDCKTYGCFSGTGYTVTPCCLKELSDMVLFTMRACEKSNVICELQEGTLLGAVKLHKVLPWERDADLTFLTSHYHAFKNLSTSIRDQGYNFVDGGSLWCCVDNRTAGGKIKVNSGNWHIELYGQHIMDSEILLTNKQKPTRLLMGGQWVGVPRNPGWHARNRYGHEIYAHSQHWLATGKSSGWINYNTRQFTKCFQQGNHNCLDRYNADGNLQFSDPLP